MKRQLLLLFLTVCFFMSGIVFMPAAETETFVPVTNIIGIPATITTGEDILFSTTVKPTGQTPTYLSTLWTIAPVNATNQMVQWDIKNDGGTNSAFTGETSYTYMDGELLQEEEIYLKATLPGTLVVTATITNGIAPGMDYTRDFEIICSASSNIDDIPQTQSLKAKVENGILYVNGLTVNKPWSVYNISGVWVYKNVANREEAEVSLPIRGIYIVTSKNSRIKVVY